MLDSAASEEATESDSSAGPGDSDDEKELAGTSTLLLPLVQLRGPKKAPLQKRRRVLAHWARFAWCALFIHAYYETIAGEKHNSRRLLSGAIQEMREEFFPDAGKTGERLTESEVAPGWKAALHADDVAKALTWFQMFCMHKAGSDDHIPWAWRCTLGSVDIGPLKPVPWNVINNSNLQSGRDESASSEHLLKHICTRPFLARRVMYGDDPRKVAFGDMAAFRQTLLESSHFQAADLAEVFDEFTVLEGNPMIEIVQAGVEEGNAVHGGGGPPPPQLRLRHRMASHLRPRVIDPARGAGAQQAGELHQASTEAGRGSEIPSWCFPHWFFVLRWIFRELALTDDDYDYKLTPEQGKTFFGRIGFADAEAAGLWEQIDKNHDEIVTLLEVMSFFHDKKGKDLIRRKKNLRYMDPVCRNHHWGLVHLCGPQHIKVNFHIENANWDPLLRTGAKYRHAFVDVTLRFTALGWDEDPQSSRAATGWYQSYIDFEADQFYALATWRSFLYACLTVLLFVPLFLVELIYTALRIPRTLFRLLSQKGRRKVTTLSGIAVHVERIVDGRHTRARFMSKSLIVLENAAAIVFLIASIDSIRTAFKPSVPNFGRVNEECEQLYEDKMMAYMSEALRAVTHKFGDVLDDSRLITPAQYILTCLQGPGLRLRNYVTLSYELLFDSPKLHALSLLLFGLRLFDICLAFKSTAWITETIFLACNRLWSFLIFFILVIAGFASLMTISFGSYFLQFRSLPISCGVLILFTFGFTEHALQGVHTWEETQSWWVTMYLLIFSILMSAILMQFFVSIVLDAYSTVKDKKSHIEERAEHFVQLYGTIAWLFFPAALADRSSYQKRFHSSQLDYTVGQLLHKTVESEGCGESDAAASSHSRAGVELTPIGRRRKTVMDRLHKRRSEGASTASSYYLETEDQHGVPSS